MRSTNNYQKRPSLDSAPKTATEEDETFLPPRNVVHPTESEKVLRIFYLSILWIFILLVAGFIFWGWQRMQGEA
ncbi:hypothetical protein [Paenibacillus agricola]|uniref:Uncharacterized protein n=1 Tax=Paenibacillus agricola TaxID=2716264 RepID=A0ABX0IXS7_9BACL|nr:hypothetical protein [Paenibacillus agricola]NHN28754.1 hypothetical protein [Paenibacillus agricola]